MSSTLTENAANANFSTGLTAPDVGVAFLTEANTIRTGSLQQLADRSQRLRSWQPTDTPDRRIQLTSAVQSGSSFTQVLSSGKIYWQQTSVAAAGLLQFPCSGYLPVGRKVTGVVAYWQNVNNTTLAVGTMPAVLFQKKAITVGGDFDGGGGVTTVGTQADTTAVVATYKLTHTITLSGLSETIADDTEYYIRFTGETGANSTTGGVLMAVRLILGV